MACRVMVGNISYRSMNLLHFKQKIQLIDWIEVVAAAVAAALNLLVNQKYAVRTTHIDATTNIYTSHAHFDYA